MSFYLRMCNLNAALTFMIQALQKLPNIFTISPKCYVRGNLNEGLGIWAHGTALFIVYGICLFYICVLNNVLGLYVALKCTCVFPFQLLVMKCNVHDCGDLELS